jgi:hypothetical protein
MKNSKSLILVLCIVLFACVSFTTIRNNERNRKQVSSRTAATADKCFDDFLKNLKTLNAMVFIPEINLEKAEALGLTSLKNTETTNTTEAVDMFSFFDQVGPVGGTEQCASSVQLTYNDLKMLILVDKNVSGKLAAAGLTKIDLKINNESLKLAGKHSKYDSFMLRIGNRELKYTPVTW